MTTLLSSLIARVQTWAARERAFRELASLDDRSLSDIGLSRGEIPFVFDRKSADRSERRVEPVIANSNVRHAA